MSEQARPWWASDGPVEGGIAPDEDPVERFRSARRGPTAAAGPELEAEPWLEAAAATMSRLAREFSAGADGSTEAPPREEADRPDGEAGGSDAPGAGTAGERTSSQGPPPHSPDVCGVCPICIGLRALAESRPELMGHLAEAARHVTLAARSLVERPERSRGGEGEEPLEHIDLD